MLYATRANMGNQPSSEGSGESRPVQPPYMDRPLPPLPPLSTQTPLFTYISQSPHASATSSAQGLSKTPGQSTIGLLRSPDAEKITESCRRFSTSSIAQLVASSFIHPQTPSSSSSAAANSSQPLPPSHPSLITPSSGAQSQSVFTFEEAAVAVAGQRDPAAWRPIASSAYPTSSLDLELLQEQQARQLEFELRQQQNQIRYQQLQLEAQRQQVELQLQRYSNVNPAIYDHHVDNVELHEHEHTERQNRGRQLEKQKQKTKGRSRRRSLFHFRSSQHPDLDQDNHGDRDRRNLDDCRRRHSIGSVYHTSGNGPTWGSGSMTHAQASGQQFDGAPSQNWPTAAASPASWNYDPSSYAAKRLLHIVNNSPLDDKLEGAPAASEGRRSLLSQVIWSDSYRDQPQSPATITRADSDFSMYAPLRRKSIVQIPGVATRRNSTSSFTSAGGGASVRPYFRTSHPITTPGLFHRASFESISGQNLSIPPPLMRPGLTMNGSSAEVARVSTPSDGEYNAIGAFKLGSLRITNGAESPMSSPETRRSKKSLVSQKNTVESHELIAAERSRALAALSAIDTSSESSGTPAAVVSATEPAIDDRQKSPFSQASFQPPAKISAASAQEATLDKITAQEPALSPSNVLQQADLSQDLFADFDFTPFSFDDLVTSVQPASPQPTGAAVSSLETTSKSTAVEDLLFEDDESTSGYANAEILDVRIDPSAKATPKRNKRDFLAAGKSAINILSVTPSDSGFVSSSTTSESSHKPPLSKADSGYSSNVSLRSFKKVATRLMSSGSKAATSRLSSEKFSTGQAPVKVSTTVDEHQFTSQPSKTLDTGSLFASSVAVQKIKRKPLPASTAHLSSEKMLTPAHNILLTAGTSTPTTSDSSIPGLLDCSKEPVKETQATPKSLDDTLAFQQLDHLPSITRSKTLTLASVQSHGSVTDSSIGSGRRRRGSFLRFLSFTSNASSDNSPKKEIRRSPTIYIKHMDDDSEQANVPSAPSSVKEKPHRHTDLFPNTAKKVVSKTQVGKDTLKGVLGVGNSKAHSSTNTSLSDTFASAADDEAPRNHTRIFRHRHMFHASSSLASVAAAAVMPLKAVTRRKSRISMPVDFSGEFEADDTQVRREFISSGGLMTPKASEGSKSGKVRRSWLRWDKEGDRQNSTLNLALHDDALMSTPDAADIPKGFQSYDDSVLVNTERKRSQRPLSRSSSIMNRTMSLTAQIERSLSQRFPKLSRKSNMNRATVPLSAFSTAHQDEALSSPLPGPFYAEATEQQGRVMVPNSINTFSMPFYEGTNLASSMGYNNIGFFSGPIAPSPQQLQPPLHIYPASWNVHNGFDNAGFPSWNDAQRVLMGSGGEMYMYGNESLDGQGRILRHRASFNGYSNNMSHTWDDGNCEAPSWQPSPLQYNPLLMSNNCAVMPHGSGHGQLGSAGSSHNESYQVRQGQTWDIKNQRQYEHAHQPPNGSRGSHGRNRSLGSRYDLDSDPHEPYRVLHSYNSPAYRGVPIWG